MVLLAGILVGGAVFTDFDERIIEIYAESSVQMDKELAGKSANTGGANLEKSLYGPIYLVGAIFAPFASLTFLDNQVTQAWLSSGVLIKNALTLFAILGMWIAGRKYMRSYGVILFLTLLYLMILGMAAHSTSPRYQLVAYPFLLMFVAFGIDKRRTLSTPTMIAFLFGFGVLILGWNYFKLSIRGLV